MYPSDLTDAQLVKTVLKGGAFMTRAKRSKITSGISL
jgi:hypothetical protein